MNWKKTAIICVAILAAGAAVTVLIFSSEPRAQRTGAVKKTAMLVEIIEVHSGTFRPAIRTTGTVEPSQDVVLSPRVEGEIIRRAPAFTPGGYVERGELLLQIDPADYENILAQRESELSQALADLEMEKGRQTVARRDYELLDDSISDEQKALVLREPQLEAAKSRVASARAAVDQARLDLERTTVEAPFDAHILSRNANVGSQVSPGDDLGRLVGLETYWVALTVPLSHLRWLDIPDNGDGSGSRVVIRNRTAWNPEASRAGHLYRLVGALEDRTRMARVLVSIPDPHARSEENEGLPRLMIGAFVEATIEGEELDGVVRLDRDHIRSDDTAWVMQDGALQIRELEIVVRDAEYAYVRAGLNDGDRVVTTNLSTVTEGAPLRTE